MSKKRRTKRSKINANNKLVKSQFVSFDVPETKDEYKSKKIEKSAISNVFNSQKKDLTKSLIVASLILASIMVLYWCA